MKQDIDKYFEEARNSIKDKAVLESAIQGMKAVCIEATGKCPCGDPNCDGKCQYGLEAAPEEPKTESVADEVENAPVAAGVVDPEALQTLEEARGDMPKADFVKVLAEAIEQVGRAPLKERLKAKLGIYSNT